MVYILKNRIFYNFVLSDLADQLGYEFLTGKGDDLCRKKSRMSILPLLHFNKLIAMWPG